LWRAGTQAGRTSPIYGGFRTPQNTLSVVDLFSQKLAPVDLGPLRAPHGLDILNGKVYFTTEGSKVIGCYNPATRRVDWVVGTGLGRTHMLKVKPDLGESFTANMTSNTISVFEQDKNADSSGWTTDQYSGQPSAGGLRSISPW
jgi:streptogramin lyase